MVAVAVGEKAAENPGASVFFLVLAGAVLIQGIKNLPELGAWAWNRAVPFDVTAPIDKAREAIETTAALNDEVLTGFDHISANNQDPLENLIWGEDLSLEVYEPGEISGLQKAYRDARTHLFTGAWARGGSLY
jgi:hypothetical protein